jgi:hypothetical protein
MNYFHSLLDVTKTMQGCQEKHNRKKDKSVSHRYCNCSTKTLNWAIFVLHTCSSLDFIICPPKLDVSSAPRATLHKVNLCVLQGWPLRRSLVDTEHAQGHLSSPKVSPSHLKLYRKWTTSDSIPAYAHECRWINICSYKRIWSCHFIFQSAYLSSFYQIT